MEEQGQSPKRGPNQIRVGESRQIAWLDKLTIEWLRHIYGVKHSTKYGSRITFIFKIVVK